MCYNVRMKARVEKDAAGNERAVWTVEGKHKLSDVERQTGRLAKGKVDAKHKAGAVKGFQNLLTVAYFPEGEELAELRKEDKTV